MPSLKTFRLRIRSVQSTQKITKAMKMVAAAKLRRAQEQATAARPYAEAMDKILASLGASFKGTGPRLLAGTGSDQTHLLIVATGDRGLCGGFNSTIVREARRQIRALQAAGKTVKIFCVGRKGRDQLRRDYSSLIVESITDLGRPRVTFGDAQSVTARLIEMFEAGEFDVASIYSGTRGFLDGLPVNRIGEYEQHMLDALRAEGSILASIRDKREIVKETDDKLKAFFADFLKKFG